MEIKTNKKDLAEKIIESEIQKTGKRLEESMHKRVVLDDEKDEQISFNREKELEELRRARAAYQLEQERQVLKIQKEEYQKRFRRRFGVAKVAVVALVAGVCLFAFSMRSEATRMWWLSSVEWIVGGERGNRVDNDDERVISETDVESAIKDIEEQTKIPMPELYYIPKEMTFSGYDHDENVARGALYYLYNDYVVTLDSYSVDENSSYSALFDGEVISEDVLDAGFGTVKIMEIRADEDKDSDMVAEWNYQNHQYRLFGKLPKEEIFKIIENILY